MSEKKRAILKVKNVTNQFGEQVVHDNISFEIEQGDIVGIVGGSGAGKSVMLRTMTGLRQPTKGSAEIAGKPVLEIEPEQSASLFGVLFQGGALFSSLTVQENIMLPLKEHTKLSEDQQQMLALLKLALVGLPPETADKMPSELSGGMVKRASLARAMAMDPPILFLDEPTAGLDPVSASAFDDLILELNKSLGITVVMITHDLDTLFTICKKVAVLVDKKIIIDTLPNLMKSNHPWIKEYFHGPRARGAVKAKEAADGNT